MDNMHLPVLLPRHGNSWTEELPDGGVEASTGSFGYDFGQKVLNIKIAGGATNLRAAIKYIVGYSQVLPIFDPSRNAVQGPYRLNRVLPAKHPHLPGLRATKILACTGRGTDKKGPKRMAAGAAGNWEYTYLSILFEIPKYPMLTDAERGDLPEYVRHTLFEYDTDAEVIARKGEKWISPTATTSGGSAIFHSDRTARMPKGTLRITTFDVHEDFVKLGRLIPQSHRKRTSTVNARSFPRQAHLDQNENPNDKVYAQFGPGELLLLPTKTVSHTQCHPAVLDGSVSPLYFPRTLDVTCTMIHLAPDTDDLLTVDLSNEGLYGIDDGDADLTLVRGHQLAPLPRPSGSGYVFYAFVNNATEYSATRQYGNASYHSACIFGGKYYSCIVGSPAPGTAPPNPAVWVEGIKKPNCLLYPYSDFEKLWAPVESVT